MSRAVSLPVAALSACLCLALTWPASAEEGAIAIVEHWLEQKDSHEWLSLSPGAVSHDASSGETTISDLVVAIRLSDFPTGGNVEGDGVELDVDYVFAIPAVVFTDLRDTDTHYTADAARAETIEIEFKIAGETASSGSGVYRGLNVRDVSWAKWPEIEDDPDRPISKFYPLIAAMVDVSFEALSFEGLTIASETVDPAFATTVTYGPGLAGPAKNGNIARMSLGAITALGQGPDRGGGPQSFGMSIGTIEAETYNYGDLVRLFDPESPIGASLVYRPVIGSISARDWIADGTDGSFKMAELRMEDFGARTPAIPVLERADELFLLAADGSDPEPDELVELIAAAYGVFRLGLMEARGMEFGGDGLRGSLELASTAGLSADGIEAIRYRNFEIGDNADMLARLGEFSVIDVGFPSLKALTGFEQASERGDFDTMLAAMPTLGAVSLSDLLVQIPGVAELSLRSTMLEMADHIGPIPTRIRTSLEGFSMPIWMLEEDEREPFEALGYETIEAGYKLDLAWQAETESIAMSAGAAFVDGGTLSLHAALGGVARDVFEDPSIIPFVLPAVTLSQAGVEFVDNSLTDRVLAIVADQQGVDTTTVRAQALGLLPFILAALQRPDFMTMIMAAANTFLEAPGALRIDLKPDEPLPIMLLVETAENDPGLAADLLNLFVSAND